MLWLFWLSVVVKYESEISSSVGRALDIFAYLSSGLVREISAPGVDERK